MELSDLLNARNNLQNKIKNIKLEKSTTFSDITKNEIYLKNENFQKTGSFKIRGALNKLLNLTDEERSYGVVCASAGNHAQGVAYAASLLGIDSLIVMSELAPIAKIMATRSYGAEVLLYGESYDDAYNKALEISKSEKKTLIHAFDDYDVIAGQGTIGLEILEELEDVDIVLVPAGGGGLLAGVSKAIKTLNSKVLVYGVESVNSNCITRAFNKGEVVDICGKYSISDGTAVKTCGKKTFDIIKDNVDGMLNVTENEIASTILYFIERSKMVVEGAGALALAAILYEKLRVTNKKIVVIVSGGNIDINSINIIIKKGLLSRGRNLKFSTIMPDKPGSLEKFSKIIAENKANIIEFIHDRDSFELDYNEAVVQLEVETSGFEHSEKLIKELRKAGYVVKIL